MPKGWVKVGRNNIDGQDLAAGDQSDWDIVDRDQLPSPDPPSDWESESTKSTTDL